MLLWKTWNTRLISLFFLYSAGRSALTSGGITITASGLSAIADYAVASSSASSSSSISDSISNPASFLICAS